MNTATDLLNIADMALVPPVLNTSPLPDYDYDQLDYGMTIGIERTPNGRLWACWVGGGDNEKAFFVLATSDDEGETWSKPRLVIDPHDDRLPYARRVIVGNLWTDPLGSLWLFFDQAMTHFDGRAGTWFTRCDQPDADHPQWSAPVRIWHGCSLNKPIVLSSGEWLLPISLWDRDKTTAAFRANLPSLPADVFEDLDGFRMANVFVSSDQGATWTRKGGIAFPHPEFDEHNLVERRDGSIWMTARVATGDVWESVSRDGGETWSQPSKTGIGHPNSRHFMRRLRSGRLLLVKHGQTIAERAPVCSPLNGYRERSQLAAYLSDDDGATWMGGLLLDERASVSYPDGTQAPDGTIFVSYDYNRNTHGEILMARFTEEDVMAGLCVSPRSRLRMLISRPGAIAARLAKENHLPKAE